VGALSGPPDAGATGRALALVAGAGRLLLTLLAAEQPAARTARPASRTGVKREMDAFIGSPRV